jgi:hypothetical protein
MKNQLINTIMKKLFFFFAMLASITASATVTITPLSVNYPNKKVTFKVAWTGTAANNRVWVWVDLCPVVGASPSTFKKAVISEPTGSGVVAGTLNGRGFYVNVNGATVTAKLDNANGKFNWCAYGSDFPPNAVYNLSGGYNLRGSSPFIITTSSGTTAVSANTYYDGTITALTDATGCPGVLCSRSQSSPGVLHCCAQGTLPCGSTCVTLPEPAFSCPLLTDADYRYYLYGHVQGVVRCVVLKSRVYNNTSSVIVPRKWWHWTSNTWVYVASTSESTYYAGYLCYSD